MTVTGCFDQLYSLSVREHQGWFLAPGSLNHNACCVCRLYLGHVHRAKGRTVSLHHISKCGGTTMCQLAASNRCSNPHLSQEKNCVLNDRCVVRRTAYHPGCLLRLLC